MKILNTLVAGGVLALGATLAMAAPASTESVEALLAVTKAQELVESSMRNAEASVRLGMKAALGKNLTPEQAQLADALPPKIVEAMRPEFSWDALKPDIVRLYVDTFSQEEVDGMIEFYRSPLGQALIAKMPAVLSRSVQLTQVRLAAALPKLQAAVASAVAEVKAKR